MADGMSHQISLNIESERDLMMIGLLIFQLHRQQTVSRAHRQIGEHFNR